VIHDRLILNYYIFLPVCELFNFDVLYTRHLTADFWVRLVRNK